MGSEELDIHAPCKVRIAELECTIVAMKVAHQAELVAAVQAAVLPLMKRINELEERVKLNSKTTNRPPSSDFPPPAVPPPKSQNPRKRGGQPGHPPHTRVLVPVNEVTSLIHNVPGSCGNCRASLRNLLGPDDPQPLRFQYLELPDAAIEVHENQVHTRRCRCCGHLTSAVLPNDVPQGMVGPKLQAFMAILTTQFELSKRQVEQFLVLQYGEKAKLSVGTISNTEGRTAESLESVWEEARIALSEEKRLHADETHWPEEAAIRYMWVLIGLTLKIGLYHINRRTKVVFQKLLPIFGGVGHSDRYAVYRLFGDNWQICWAHLGRDFKRLELREDESQKIGKACLEAKDSFFEIWWTFKKGLIDRTKLQELVKPFQTKILETLREGKNCKNPKTATFCGNLLSLWPNMWLFLKIEGVEPTNNEGERAARKAVLLRKKSYGTDSARGSRFIERMLTVIESCRRQGRNALEFVTKVIEAGLKNLEPPSLVQRRVEEVPAPA